MLPQPAFDNAAILSDGLDSTSGKGGWQPFPKRTTLHTAGSTSELLTLDCAHCYSMLWRSVFGGEF